MLLHTRIGTKIYRKCYKNKIIYLIRLTNKTIKSAHLLAILLKIDAIIAQSYFYKTEQVLCINLNQKAIILFTNKPLK